MRTSRIRELDVEISTSTPEGEGNGPHLPGEGQPPPAFAWRADNGSRGTVDLSQGEVPPCVILKALTSPDVTKHAWNASEVRRTLSRWFIERGLLQDGPLSPENWRDTRMVVRCAGLSPVPREAAVALGLPFGEPDPPSPQEARDPNVVHIWQISRMKHLLELKSDLRHTLRDLLTKEIWEEYRLDQEINRRGICVDRDMCIRASARFRTLEKESSSCSDAPDPFQEILRRTDPDGRLRDALVFFGSHPTGQWETRIPMTYELGFLNPNELCSVRDLILNLDEDQSRGLSFCMEKVLRGLVPAAFVPAPGHIFVKVEIPDLDGNLLSWLSTDTRRMDCYLKGEDPAVRTAAAMYMIPPEIIHRGDPQWIRGLLAEYALRYDGGPEVMEQACASVGIPPKEALDLYRRWTRSSREIVETRGYVTGLLWEAFVSRGSCICWPFRLYVRRDHLVVQLPTGRVLIFRDMKLLWEGARPFLSCSDSRGGPSAMELTGAMVVEVAIRALQRDMLGWILRGLQDWPVVFVTDSSVVVEAPLGTAPQSVLESLPSLPAWTRRLNLKPVAITIPCLQAGRWSPAGR